MEKSLLVARPFQLIARTKREAYRCSGSGGSCKQRDFADEGAAYPPEGGLLASFGTHEAPRGEHQFSKEKKGYRENNLLQRARPV